jgi:hypothetical protein
MEKTQIKNISIIHEPDGRVKQVLINNEDFDNISINIYNFVTNFNPFRPDNIEISFPKEYEQVFQDLFNVIDDLFLSKKGCLAAYLSSFLYEKLTPIWNQLMGNGQHILAIQYWRKIISITHEWEKRNSKHIHKGSPYAFIAYTYFLIGDIDNGFSYIYNAIEEDIILNSRCPQLNYPRSAPVYLTASLSSNPNNIMYPIVHDMRSELEVFLNSYRKSFGSKFDINELDKKISSKYRN